MPRAQTGLEQLLAQSRQQSESTIFEEQFILHPYCESRMYLLCTFKIITKSPCFNGSGAPHGAAQFPRHAADLSILLFGAVELRASERGQARPGASGQPI